MKVTSLNTAGRVVSGHTRVDFLGRVVTAAGDPVVGAQLDVDIVPDIGPVQYLKVTTGTTGGWVLMNVAPVYSATIRTYFRGTPDLAPGFATSYRLPVSPWFGVTFPMGRTTTPTAQPFVVRGLVLPVKPGATVTLLDLTAGRYVAIARTTVVGNGFAFSTRLAHGKHTLKVGIGRTNGNWLGYSAAFGADRS